MDRTDGRDTRALGRGGRWTGMKTICRVCRKEIAYRDAVHLRAHDTAAYPHFKAEPFDYANICRQCYRKIFRRK